MTVPLIATTSVANPFPGLPLGMATAEFLFHFAIISGAAMLLWLGVNWVERLRVQRFLNARTPKTLFRELCRAHGLSRAERRCVALIAQPSRSDRCCHVFIDPQVIDEFARANPAAASECRQLAWRLFGEQPP